MQQPVVTIYSTATCHYCSLAKDYLQANKVDYREVDVGVDREGAKEMITKSGQMGVPVIDIGGEIIIGFQPKIFDKLLGLKK